METNFEVIKGVLDSLMETESEIMNSKKNQQLYDDIFEKTKILISGGLTKDELFTGLKKSTYLCVLHQSLDSDAFKSTIDLIISRVEIDEEIEKAKGFEPELKKLIFDLIQDLKNNKWETMII